MTRFRGGHRGIERNNRNKRNRFQQLRRFGYTCYACYGSTPSVPLPREGPRAGMRCVTSATESSEGAQP